MADQRIYRGTTPTIALDVDADLTGWEVHVYLRNRATLYDLTPTVTATEDGCTCSVTLTQEQTLALASAYPLRVQLRAKSGSVAVASDVVALAVIDVLKDGVL